MMTQSNYTGGSQTNHQVLEQSRRKSSPLRRPSKSPSNRGTARQQQSNQQNKYSSHSGNLMASESGVQPTQLNFQQTYQPSSSEARGRYCE